MQFELIFIRKILCEDLFWNRGERQLGTTSFPGSLFLPPLSGSPRLLLFCITKSNDWLKRTRATFPPIRSKTEYGKLRIVPGTRGFLNVDPNQTGECLKYFFMNNNELPAYTSNNTTFTWRQVEQWKITLLTETASPQMTSSSSFIRSPNGELGRRLSASRLFCLLQPMLLLLMFLNRSFSTLFQWSLSKSRAVDPFSVCLQAPMVNRFVDVSNGPFWGRGPTMSISSLPLACLLYLFVLSIVQIPTICIHVSLI